MRVRTLLLASFLTGALPLPAHPRVLFRAGLPVPRPVVVVHPPLPVLAPPPVVVVGHRHGVKWCRRHHRHHRWHRGCW